MPIDFDLWKFYKRNKNWLAYVFVIYAILNIIGVFFNVYRTELLAARASKTDEILQQNSELLGILNNTLGNSTYIQTCSMVNSLSK